MDLLRINEQEGQFLKNGVWIPICDIERDDLLECSCTVKKQATENNR